jgi:hypothetical protein
MLVALEKCATPPCSACSYSKAVERGPRAQGHISPINRLLTQGWIFEEESCEGQPETMMSTSVFKKIIELLGQHNTPYLVWRNPTMSGRVQPAKYYVATFDNRCYQVYEEGHRGSSALVTTLTLIDGGRAAA